jgi:hypothetical protein
VRAAALSRAGGAATAHTVEVAEPVSLSTFSSLLWIRGTKEP